MAFGLFPFFLLLFIVFPIAEIALLIFVGQQIGLIWTLAIVVSTAILGTTLLRAQGFGVLSRVNEATSKGDMPVVPVMEGMFLLIAGAFLLTPGIITDAIGGILLIPPLRIAIARGVLKQMLSRGAVSWSVHKSQARPGTRSHGDGRGREGLSDNVIEGEFERVDDETSDRDGRS